LCCFEIWHPKYAGKAPKVTDRNCRQNNTQCKMLKETSPFISSPPSKNNLGQSAQWPS